MDTSVDHARVHAGQAMTAIVLIIAFATDLWPLAALVGALNLLGSLWPSLSLFGRIYDGALRPLGLVRPRPRPGSPAPHRFAQGFSGVVTGSGAALLAGSVSAGWALVGLVVALAALNLAVGFCAGCFTYRQLAWLGVPGFTGEDRCLACELPAE